MSAISVNIGSSTLQKEEIEAIAFMVGAGLQSPLSFFYCKLSHLSVAWHSLYNYL